MVARRRRGYRRRQLQTATMAVFERCLVVVSLRTVML